MKKYKAYTLVLIFLFAVILVGCVSPKKYQSALNDVDRMRADSTARANQLAKVQYNMAMELNEKTMKLDSIRELAQARKQKLDLISQQLHEALPTLDRENLETFLDGGYLHITLPHRVLFYTGEKDLTSDGKEAISKLAQTLKDVDSDIMILGHTDSVPIGSKQKDNWKLSFERSHKVMEQMVKNGVSPESIIVAGRSKYDPTLDNTSQIGRFLNRRIELILLPDMNIIESVAEQLSPNAGM